MARKRCNSRRRNKPSNCAILPRSVRFSKALSVILAAEYGFDADQTADVLGTSRRTVFRDRSSIRNQDDTSKKTWGGRRLLMTIEEEREFLSQWQEKATEEEC